MAATVIAQRRLFVNVQDEVAHKCLMQNRWYPNGQPLASIENEDEVKFIGQECYMPRLVASNVPSVTLPEANSGLKGCSQRQGYAEPLQAKRPGFLRDVGGVAASTGMGLPSGGGPVARGKGASKGHQGQVQDEKTGATFPYNLAMPGAR
eukprot:TRINITY_DN4120_c0_g1_i2.p1 TRINITY_DN4120_c0_g1~~TRINITY_DN4120_c0_g1_i2.p1  ORF type:complete len:163 (-),score=39.64 TRINITY_DN4120_c0_g1_i2:817-1266(-)